MNTGNLIRYGVGLAFFSCSTPCAAQIEEAGVAIRALSFVPYVRNNPCAERYRQLVGSPPLRGTSDGGEGYPWRILYGYCVAQNGRLTLHQDWVVSYLDATPKGEALGGDGVSFGSDFSFQWRHRKGATFMPYYELGAGIQYATGTAFPANGSRWMFTINAGAGILFPLKPKLQLNTAIRYLHISNAGLLGENAGYDAFHLIVGIRW